MKKRTSGNQSPGWKHILGRVLKWKCMGKRSSSTRSRTGIQFAKPAQASISAVERKRCCAVTERLVPDYLLMVHVNAPRRVYKDGTLCVRRHEVCFPIKQEAPFWNGYGRKQQQYPHCVPKRWTTDVCKIRRRGGKTTLKDAWTDVGTKKSLAAPKER